MRFLVMWLLPILYVFIGLNYALPLVVIFNIMVVKMRTYKTVRYNIYNIYCVINNTVKNDWDKDLYYVTTSTNAYCVINNTVKSDWDRDLY